MIHAAIITIIGLITVRLGWITFKDIINFKKPR